MISGENNFSSSKHCANANAMSTYISIIYMFLKRKTIIPETVVDSSLPDCKNPYIRCI